MIVATCEPSREASARASRRRRPNGGRKNASSSVTSDLVNRAPYASTTALAALVGSLYLFHNARRALVSPTLGLALTDSDVSAANVESALDFMAAISSRASLRRGES